MSPAAYVALALLAMLALTAWLVFRPGTRNDWLKNALLLVMVLYVLVSPHYPWYFAWPLLLLTTVPYLPMLFLTVASFILYETSLGETAAMLFRLNTLLYIPFGLLVLAHVMARRLRMRANYSTGVGN